MTCTSESVLTLGLLTVSFIDASESAFSFCAVFLFFVLQEAKKNNPIPSNNHFVFILVFLVIIKFMIFTNIVNELEIDN